MGVLANIAILKFATSSNKMQASKHYHRHTYSSKKPKHAAGAHTLLEGVLLG